MAEIEVRETSAEAGKTIRDLRIRHETGAIVVSLRKADGSFDTTPEPDAVIEAGDVIIGVGTPDEMQRLEDLFAPRARPLPADPVRTLAAALADAAGRGARARAAGRPEHGDYATNVALRLAGTRRQPPRELAAEIAQTAAGLPVVERAESRGRASSTSSSRDAWFGEALGEILEAGRRRTVAAAPSAASASRSRWSRRTRRGRSPSHRPATAPTATLVARLLELAGHEVEREYYYNDAGAQMDRFRASVDAVRRGEEPPEDGYHGDYIADLAASTGDPVPLMLEQIETTLERFRIHFDSWGLQSELEQRLPELLPRLDTYEKDGALWARTSAYGDDKDRVLLRSPEGGSPTYRAADVAYLADKLERGFDRAIYVLGADHHGTRNWYAAVARMLGYDPDRVEVLLYQLVHLTRGGEQTKMSKRRGDVVFLDELHRRDRRRRRALVPRQPRPRPDDRDRRRPRRGASRRRTPSTTSSTRTRGSPGSSATPATRQSASVTAGAARAGGAGARQAARRAARESSADAAEKRGPQGVPALRDPRRRRLPPLLPRAPRARERAGGVPARPLPRDADGDRALPRPRRGRGT